MPRAEPPAHGPLFRLDPGWLFLLAGATLLSATLLIPAYDDLAEARWHHQRAAAVESFRTQRLANYSEFLDALTRREEPLVLALAATQLNLAPDDKLPMIDISPGGLAATGSASIFPTLEPVYHAPPQPARPDSYLQRWATNDRTRLWLIAVGAISILVGLLPPSGVRSLADSL